MATELIVNPTNPREINMAVELMRTLSNKRRPQRITVVELRDRRSNPQNALYWVAIIQPFAEWLYANGYGKEFGDLKQYAHDTLKRELLTVPLANPNTGEVLSYRVRSTTELNTEEFSAFIEDCARWLAEHCDLPVHLPSEAA
jgi:hypothetical protein